MKLKEIRIQVQEKLHAKMKKRAKAQRISLSVYTDRILTKHEDEEYPPTTKVEEANEEANEGG